MDASSAILLIVTAVGLITFLLLLESWPNNRLAGPFPAGDTAWAMSEENVEIVARLVDTWNQANVEAMLALFDPECEVIFPPEVPEPGPFRGHTELREWAEGFLAAWESHHAEVVELIEADHSIVAILHLIGRGSGSGIEMDETDAHVFTFSDGKVTRWRNFSDRSAALEAAGLLE